MDIGTSLSFGGPHEEAAGANSSLLRSFIIAARFRGVHLTPSQVVHDHLLASEDVSIDQLIDIAKASGLRAVGTRFQWSDLMRLGKALPVIVRLSNGSAMVLLRT